jgi:hypothetical protein
MTSAANGTRNFRELADGGRVVMPLEKTFWAERFGMLVDRFGIFCGRASELEPLKGIGESELSR